jgi:transposase
MERVKMEKPREFSAEFKVGVVKRMQRGESAMKLQRELGIKRSILYRWADTCRREGEAGLGRKRGRPGSKVRVPSYPDLEQLPEASQQQITIVAEQQAKRIAELERVIGKQAMDIDFLARAFKRVNEPPLASPSSGGMESTGRSGK